MNVPFEWRDKLEDILFNLANVGSMVRVVCACLDSGEPATEVCAQALHGADESLCNLTAELSKAIGGLEAAE